jgi:putative two-component system response regulator
MSNSVAAIRPHTDARILIVDDQDNNVRFLEMLLRRAGYGNLWCTTDPRRGLMLAQEIEPDLILLDLRMPHLSGYEIMEILSPQISTAAYLPILVLTADLAPAAKERALAGGAKDFLTKPFDPTEVRLRIHNLLETRFLHLSVLDHNRRLEERVLERTAELEQARIEILKRLATAAEFRDDVTGSHIHRVGRISALLARALGLSETDLDLLERAAPLHDVGKIGIPDIILLKPGKLTPEEFEVMKNHTTIGAQILSRSAVPLLNLAEQIALSHHERWDGTGYPRGVDGRTIPLAARIVSVADAFDAMTSNRPYRQALRTDRAIAILRGQAGGQWDPDVVHAFAALEIPLAGSDVLQDRSA